MALVYLGIGTNLGDRHDNIRRAKSELLSSGKINIIKESLIEETAPVDFIDQPHFLNQVILTETGILPPDLLTLIKNTEKKMGREKTIEKGPRIIDLDILLYDDIVLLSAELKIPHPEIKNRKFILKHLLEISPDLCDPRTGESYSLLLRGS